MNIKDNSVEAQVGVMLGKIVKETIKRNLTGMESMVGVPGTLGGALIMNAGAFGGEISNCLDVIKVMTMDGKIKFYNKNDIGFSYRNSTFPKNEILLSATFALNEKPADEIQFDRARASKGRKESQPLRYRSAGSVFKNPKADLAAGYLIDQAGLKGSRIGDAEISTKHANFFINHGKAKAKDIVGLILLIGCGPQVAAPATATGCSRRMAKLLGPIQFCVLRTNRRAEGGTYLLSCH